MKADSRILEIPRISRSQIPKNESSTSSAKLVLVYTSFHYHNAI